MAFDGIVIANLVYELNQTILGGRINKIAQPEADELLLTIKSGGSSHRLTISANASLPLMYLTQTNKPSPMTAPGFCMLLRKHIGNGRITAITQPGLERIIDITLEHLNEMGDLCQKHLIVELMGKHSNIIFCDHTGMILDSIKHVSSLMSSLREVLPGRPYFIPKTSEKEDPFEIDYDTFCATIFTKPMNLSKALYSSLTGISPLISEEICHLASLESHRNAPDCTPTEQIHLFHIFQGIMEDLREKKFSPNILFRNSEPVDFSSIPLSNYTEYQHREYESISLVLEQFYATKNVVSRIRQRSTDLRRIVNSSIERDAKKLDLLEKQLLDTQKRDKFRIYGELLNAYGYSIPAGSKSYDALNYYTNEEVTIPLDASLTPSENAVKYFERYNKLKRTFEATTNLIQEVSEELTHLESIQNALDIAQSEEDLIQIKEELILSGYIHKKGTAKKERFTSKPFHYISSDGFHIYVGKNNLQNDDLTFKFADSGDWWFHAKDLPGSHVIVKTEGAELPDRTFEEAASLAAYYSKARAQEKVEVDYTQRRNIKKPNASKPGFVIYHTNYSLLISPDISQLNMV